MRIMTKILMGEAKKASSAAMVSPLYEDYSLYCPSLGYHTLAVGPSSSSSRSSTSSIISSTLRSTRLYDIHHTMERLQGWFGKRSYLSTFLQSTVVLCGFIMMLLWIQIFHAHSDGDSDKIM